MATTVLGLKTFAASDPVDYNEINDNYNKIDNGVKTAFQGRAAHNLLDNSDFRNPVNQRGITSQVGGGYGLDRWRADGSGTISVGSTGVSLTNLSFRQPVSLKAGTYTLAFHLSNGTTLRYIFKFDGADTLNAINSSGNETTGAYINYYKHATGVVMVQIVVAEGYTKIVEWAALYEGSYDASTLPAYQPKGYAAELAECQRYYENSWFGVGKTAAQEYFANIWSGGQADARIEFKQQKRISPTITFYPIGTGSNWKIFNNGYQFVDSVENKGRGGLSGFIARVSKGSSDGTTWTIGETIQAQGHWEASADL